MNDAPTLLESLSSHLNFRRHRYGSELHQQFAYVWGVLMRYPVAYEAFSSHDLELNHLVLAFKQKRWGSAWFHGGATGQRPTDTLLPPSISGVPDIYHSALPPSGKRLIFLTPCASFAGAFARERSGTLYEVEPDSGISVAPFKLRALRFFEEWIGEKEARDTLLCNAALQCTCQSAIVLKVLREWQSRQMV